MKSREVILKNDKIFSAEFKEKPIKFRIEAVIHDGQYYTKEKWATVSKCKISEIEDFIKECDYLIQDNESYRVDGQEIAKWYQKQNLPIRKPLVPNNFIPKIWQGYTEVEHFLKTPKRRVSSILIYCRDISDLKATKDALYTYAQCKEDEHRDVLRVHTISPDYIMTILQQNLSKEIYDRLKFRVRTNIGWRDMSEFSHALISEMLDFYLDYSKGILRPHMKTLEIFIPSHHDREVKIQEWILRAINKFDENNYVPFSGYLANVIQRWTYDLPNNELGVELAKFQRERTKAITYFTEQEIPYKEEDIRVYLNYEQDKYYRLLEEHETWTNLKLAEPLNWEDKGNEKIGQPLFHEERNNEYNTKLATKITLALLKTAEMTNDYESLFKVTDSFSNYDMERIDLNETFKQSLWQNLKDDR